MISRKPDKKMTPDRTLPIVFQMVQPVSGLDQRRTLSANRVSQAYAVCCPAVANFLALIGNCQSIALDRKGLDLVRYVLEIFRPQAAIPEGQLLLNLIIGLTRKADED